MKLVLGCEMIYVLFIPRSSRFLDNRLFATCSDDTTVKLWDARNLSAHVRTLSGGHTKWVKNVEYVSRSNTLVTSGFDGSIFQWDLNKYSDEASEWRTECRSLRR